MLVLSCCARSKELCQAKVPNVTFSTTANGQIYTEYDVASADCLENLRLRGLRIDGCLHHIYPETIANMRYLRTLSIDGVSLYTLSPKFVLNVPSLERVSITQNPLSTIDEEVFANFKIKNLILSSNMLRVLKYRAFRNARFECLDLSNNRLEYLNSKAFQSFKVDRLILANNKLMSLTKYTFRGIVRLSEVVLSYNNIYHIEDMTFKKFSNSNIFLRGNMLTRINFLNNTKVKYLDLSLNKLSYIWLDQSTKLGSIAIYPNPWDCSCLKRFWRYVDYKSISIFNEQTAKSSDLICIAKYTQCTENNNFDNLREEYFRKIDYEYYFTYM